MSDIVQKALFQQPHDSLEPGTVCSVVKTGYMLKDLVLRPAEVTFEVEALP